MPLRLDKLPDRTPVRMSISLEPDLASALKDYAALYERSYGMDEKPETLIPAMLDTFLNSDVGFKRARKSLHSPQMQGE